MFHVKHFFVDFFIHLQKSIIEKEEMFHVKHFFLSVAFKKR